MPLCGSGPTGLVTIGDVYRTQVFSPVGFMSLHFRISLCLITQECLEDTSTISGFRGYATYEQANRALQSSLASWRSRQITSDTWEVVTPKTLLLLLRYMQENQADLVRLYLQKLERVAARRDLVSTYYWLPPFVRQLDIYAATMLTNDPRRDQITQAINALRGKQALL